MNSSRRNRASDTDAGRAAGSKRRRFLEGVAAGAIAAPLAGCLETFDTVAGSPEDRTEVVTVGVLAPEPDSDFNGRAIERSARLAVDQLDDDGGIDGRDVELVVGDTKGDPLEGRREYQRLVLDEGADVTVGISTSEVLDHVIEDVAEQETIHITAGAATTGVSDLVREQYDDYRYHFRAGPVNEYDLGQAQIDFLTDMAGEMGWESIALLAEDYGWSEGPWETFQQQRDELEVDIVVEERYSPALDDFTDIYDEAETAGADAVFISTAHTGTDAILDWTGGQRPFEFGGIHVPMQLPTYYDATNGACLYGIGQSSAPLGADVTEKTSTFEDAYEDRYGVSTPVYTGYFAYDAVTLFAEAVEQAGTFDADDLVGTLEDIAFTGSAGQIEFYGRDHEYPHDLVYQRGETLYFQWQEDDDGEGTQEVIWPDEHATSEYVEPDWS
ncbi:ABC transporter substrate-binding protein [Natrarchaeobaculum aegyptiacum]|uniref:ABC transporter substrate-binding protein n=1 Tax=Natrarchaeobaculum aegyptiacum TaxID=745377 RepID=A0A2Z2HSB2_9EURY|nr:ABC transporter substrate-binding protein [Natrarchaeobaculum aegyptiacum]ARS90091.1 ABC transporter substrate-binding protein [Natrarchaeobaculum aegyptiacum]